MATFTNLKKRVASNIGYVDSSGVILTGKDVTETDIGNWMNDRYLDDVVAALMTQYPEDYTEKDATMNFYKASSTISTITNTALVSAGAIFNSAMAGKADTGDRLYNSDIGTYSRIVTYTSTTAVTLADDMDATWTATDPIYVLGHEFPLGGNATDIRDILRVQVMYNSEDDYYTECKFMGQLDVMKSGTEVYTSNYSEGSPIYYITTRMVSSVPTMTLGILPEPEEAVASGIKLDYTFVPSAMSSDSDVPRLPLSSHSILVEGATSDALKKLRRTEEASYYEQRYQALKEQLLAEYPLTRASGPRYVRAEGSKILDRFRR